MYSRPNLLATAQVTEAPEQAVPERAPTPPAPPTPSAPMARRRVLPILLVLAALLGIIVWRLFFAAPALPSGVVATSGRIEGDDSAIAPKVTGKILEIHYREGDSVKAGDVIAVLDDAQVQAQEEAARAALLDSQDKAQAARDQIAILQQQLQQNQIQFNQAKTDAAGRVNQAEAQLAAVEATLVQQQAALSIAEFNRRAYSRLAAAGAVSKQQGLQAEATADQQAAAVQSAQKQVDAARGDLTTAQANLDNPPIRQASVDQVQRQIVQQQAQIRAAAAEAAQAEAQLKVAEANRADLTVMAPFNGTIITRAAEPGEVVQAGTPIVTLLDLTKVYLRGFIPEGQIGEVKVGQPARVFLDSAPNQLLEAYVLRVDPEATFTPENTYFREDRVKEVVGVKLGLKQGFGFAKPGMPAGGEVLVKGDVWPPHLQGVQ